MLFLDPSLKGRQVTIRPSMKKFEAPSALNLEIAEVFVRPKPCMLNRPLIKILEDLGAPVSGFLALQRSTIKTVELEAGSIKTASSLLKRHSIGGVYSVPVLFEQLANMKLDFAATDLPDDLAAFLHDSMTFARVTIFRDLKFHARIPLPSCYTLVGGVDESATLVEGQVFICLDRLGDGKLEYIKGLVVVTRPPAMHPGDVRQLQAVGRPLSPFLAAQRNVIIFSSNGSRAEASKMVSPFGFLRTRLMLCCNKGGGDLDVSFSAITSRLG